eukprot:15326051-Alexandrium_andersonii.AAC.1
MASPCSTPPLRSRATPRRLMRASGVHAALGPPAGCHHLAAAGAGVASAVACRLCPQRLARR